MALLILFGATAVGACGRPAARGPSPAQEPSPIGVRQTSSVTAASVDPNFDDGQDVFITKDGFRPAWLVATTYLPITWHNVSGSVRSVSFANLGKEGVDSGPIPPGGVFVYTPRAPLSIVYRSTLGPKMVGRVQVLLPVET